MVRVEFVPLPDYTQRGFCFEDDPEEFYFNHDKDTYVSSRTDVGLAQEVVDQLHQFHVPYLIDGYVYQNRGYCIVEKIDRSPLLPEIYQKAKERLHDAFDDEDMDQIKPIRLMYLLEELKYPSIQSSQDMRKFYFRVDVLSRYADVWVVFLSEQHGEQSVMRVCRLHET